MGNAQPDFVRELHAPLSLTSRFLAPAAAPLARGAVSVAGVPLSAVKPAAIPPLSVPAMPAAPLLAENSVPVAAAAAPVAEAVPMLALAAPI